MPRRAVRRTIPGRPPTPTAEAIRIGRALRQARKGAKMSLERMAGRTGVHRNTIWRIERAIHPMPLDLFLRFCEALETSPSAMMSTLEAAIGPK
jgi:transcriptional regulator with XRE-family HTH domain